MTAREPVDGELIRPGWVREPEGRKKELRMNTVSTHSLLYIHCQGI